ncbi:MAG: lamin tail domain-containing protein [candidate division KSB1 bacterium]|nr:lamin tail domain-containing protein [candidate division KSB1 bacterium]MDZ7303456.1 lamin tail domain-containing protein [candidate division KSB1 bacterium]MDZ7312538.1 lamin tail domain-containing protein [candidate division KSB1 bacterium]
MQRLFILLILVTCRIASAQVILSEVMFNPSGNENTNEFIEIYNASTSDSLSLAGWRIGDQTEIDLLVSPDLLYWLAPGQFAIVLDPGYFQSSTLYDSLIPPQALILTIDDNSFGSGGLSNSTAETVVLVDAAGETVARYTYSLDNPDGISDEKIFLNADDSSQNWANSLRLHGTPGQRNSVSPRLIDGELVARSFRVSPAWLREGQTAILNVTLRNNGLQAIVAAAVDFWIIQSSANLSLPFHLGSAELPYVLQFSDSAHLTIAWQQTIMGRHEIMANLILSGDENHSNDTLRTSMVVGHQQEVVRINEIMYYPKSGQPEWIEVFNPQSTAISLADWQLEDESGARGIAPRHATVPPFSHLVLAANSTVATVFNIADSLVTVLDHFPTLNNSGDVLLLRDFSGAVIDSVAYQANWGAPGISAEKVWYERVNTGENWRPSWDPRGGTPATINSVSPRETDLAAVHLEFEPPRPRAGGDVDLIATIQNHGRRAVDRFIVTFALDHNHDGEVQDDERINAVTVEQMVPVEHSLVVRQFLPRPPSGRHQILATVSTPFDAVPGNDRISACLAVGYSSRSVVINEVYNAPRTGEVEWVEFYNRSNQPVDLSSWQWREAEAKTPIVLPDSALILAPGEFVLLAASRNIVNAEPSARLVVPKSWLTLNNDREQLVLADFHGGFQDSLAFTQHWGGGTGISLERINPHLASGDSSNWNSCVDPNGSTPGRINSIFTDFVPTQATVTASPQPFSPDGDGHEDFAIIQIQVPSTTATVHLKIYDVRGRLVRHLLNNTPIGANYQAVWNGRDDDNRPAATGIYILYLQAIQANSGILVEARTTLVLARKLN